MIITHPVNGMYSYFHNGCSSVSTPLNWSQYLTRHHILNITNVDMPWLNNNNVNFSLTYAGKSPSGGSSICGSSLQGQRLHL